MAKAIINYKKGRREFLDKLYEDGIFGLSRSMDNKDQAIFFASLGADDPVPFQSPDPGGWFRTESVRTAADKAMMSIALLGTFNSDEDIDKFSDYDTYMDYFEQCAEKGFQIIEEKASDAGYDNTLLERRVLKELDLLYIKIVENDI